MLFLKPIINEIGNSYVEAETRNRERMDLVIDYRGEQSIIELKVWRGNAYNKRGEKQLSDYLDYFHLKKGYMLSLNFNKKKKTGIQEIVLGDKILREWILPRIAHPLGLVKSNIIHSQVLKHLKQRFPKMSESHRAVVREVLFDQHMAVESSHLRDGEDADASE